MTRTLKLYQGADMDPEWDYSDWVEWGDCEFGTRAHNGEATQGQLRIRDERGETGNELNLPGGLTYRGMSAHNVMTLTEDASGSEKHLWRGWVIPKDYTRGAQKADRAREISVSVEDMNTELRGIIVGRDAPWSRPAETDVQRVTALLGDYLNGDPRASTVIGDAYVDSGNTVTLDAKDYEDATIEDVLLDCATPAEKKFWVILNDDGSMDLFYDVITSSAYSSTLEIRQTGDITETDGETTFGPVWDVGPASREDGQGLLSGVKVKGPPGVSGYASHALTVDSYNHYEEVVHDQFVETDAQAAAKAAGILSVRRFEERTYSCSIYVPADRVHLIKAGMNITIQAKAIPDADDQVVTRRIGQLKLRLVNPDLYKVSLQLDRPMRENARGTGTPVGPKPPKPSTPGSVTVYEQWDWNSGEETVANIYAPDLPGPVQMLVRDTTTGPDPGAVGTSHSGNFGFSNISGGRVACTAGTTYRFFGYLWLFGDSWPSTAFGRVNGSWGVSWYTSGDVLIHTDVIGSYANAQQDGPWLGPDEIDLVAPTGAVYFRMRSAIDPLLPSQPWATHIDEVTISVVNAAGTSGTTPPSLGGPGEGQIGDADTYLPTNSVIEHGDLSDKGGIMHDASQIEADDPGDYFDGETVGAQLQELAEDVATIGTDKFLDKGYGGRGNVQTIPASGSALELDLGDGDNGYSTFLVTLDDDCAISFAGLTNGVECRWAVHVYGDGASVASFPGVLWPGGIAPDFDPTAGSHRVEFVSYDGGATVYGDFGGGSTASSTTLVPLMAQDPADDRWFVVVDGDGNAVMVEAS